MRNTNVRSRAGLTVWRNSRHSECFGLGTTLALIVRRCFTRRHGPQRKTDPASMTASVAAIKHPTFNLRHIWQP